MVILKYSVLQTGCTARDIAVFARRKDIIKRIDQVIWSGDVRTYLKEKKKNCSCSTQNIEYLCDLELLTVDKFKCLILIYFQ